MPPIKPPTHRGTTVRNAFGRRQSWRVPLKAARALKAWTARQRKAFRHSIIPAKHRLMAMPRKELAALCVSRGLRGGESKEERRKWRDPNEKIRALLKLRRQQIANACPGRVEVGSALPLILKKQPFQVMVTGEKREEFRKNSAFIKQRLMYQDGRPKLFREVEFTNGYGHSQPRFYAQYMGFSVKRKVYRKYSNGLEVKLRRKTYVLHLGRVRRTENLSVPEGGDGRRVPKARGPRRVMNPRVFKKKL